MYVFVDVINISFGECVYVIEDIFFCNYVYK